MAKADRALVIELDQDDGTLDAWHSAVAAHVPRGTNLEEWGPVGEVVSLWLHTAQSRAEWTRQLLGRLERGLYRMADDKPNLTTKKQ